MVLKIYSNYFFFLFFILISCKSEPAKIADESVMRNEIIDSTITAFQKKLLAQQIDSVFSKTKFNGSISIVQNGKKLYEKENGLEDFLKLCFDNSKDEEIPIENLPFAQGFFHVEIAKDDCFPYFKSVDKIVRDMLLIIKGK